MEIAGRSKPCPFISVRGQIGPRIEKSVLNAFPCRESQLLRRMFGFFNFLEGQEFF
jgi:hypothetical protein